MWGLLLALGKRFFLNRKSLAGLLAVALALGAGWGVKMVFEEYSQAKSQLNRIQNDLSTATGANEALMRQLERMQEQREREQQAWARRQDKLEEIASQDREREVIIREVKDETEMQCVDATVPSDVYDSLLNYATGSGD